MSSNYPKSKLDEYDLTAKVREEIDALFRDPDLSDSAIADILNGWGYEWSRSGAWRYRKALGLGTIDIVEDINEQNNRTRFMEQSESEVFLDTGVRREALKISADWHELLEFFGLSPDDFIVIPNSVKINSWEQSRRTEEGDRDIINLWAYKARFAKRIDDSPDGDHYPFIQPGPPLIVKPTKVPSKKKQDDEWLKAITLPDIQFGYWIDRKKKAHPTHDEGALDIALQIVAYEKPDVIIMHGDNLDFTELSLKFEPSTSSVDTTEMAIHRADRFCAQLRATAGPSCKIVWLEGNHEHRLSKLMTTRLKPFKNFRLLGEDGDYPLLSVPMFCHLDEHNIEYRDGYPGSEYWINDRLVVIHGDKVASNGSTAMKYLHSSRNSVIFGHVHRREWLERTSLGGPNKSHTIAAISPGCLCRTDGAVPSTKGGEDSDGEPVFSVENWQQGLAIVKFKEGNGKFHPALIPFQEGTAMYGGVVYTATVDVEGNPLGGKRS